MRIYSDALHHLCPAALSVCIASAGGRYSRRCLMREPGAEVVIRSVAGLVEIAVFSTFASPILDETTTTTGSDLCDP